MMFGGYSFPSNPSEISVKASVNYSTSPIFGEGSEVQNVSVNPSVVKGKGEFYGDKGEECCEYLMHMLKARQSADLILPSQHGMSAYLTEFSYSRSANKNAVSYSFTFVECTGFKLEYRDFYQTIAKAGENAFDIANRCDTTVEAIMQKNDFMTPFSVKAGDRVVIR